jgi:hypothetical protein
LGAVAIEESADIGNGAQFGQSVRGYQSQGLG